MAARMMSPQQQATQIRRIMKHAGFAVTVKLVADLLYFTLKDGHTVIASCPYYVNKHTDFHSLLLDVMSRALRNACEEVVWPQH